MVIRINPDGTESVLFFYERQAHGEFSNFYEFPITAEIFDRLDENGEPTDDSVSLGIYDFPTAEHLFQALKFSQSRES